MHPFRHALLIFAVGLCALLQATAGPVSLEPTEIQQLRSLLRTDLRASQQFAPVIALADQALVEPPTPVEHVVSEGHLATDPNKIKTIAAFKDLDKTEALAWAWAITGNPQYLARTSLYLTAWARVNKPDGDAINEAAWEAMLVAYDLVRTSMQPSDRLLVDAWLRGKADKLMSKPARNNNWGGHAVKAVGLIGLTIEYQPAIAWAVHVFKNLIQVEIHPDGSTTDFYQRDALHYQLGGIVPLLEFARPLARNGENLFDYAAPSGATLHKAVDFVKPFAQGLQVHMEFLHTHVQFDRQRAQDNEATYVPHQWDPKASIDMFVLASWFQPGYGALAAQIAGHPGEAYFNWAMVLNAVSRHIVSPAPTLKPPAAAINPALQTTRAASLQKLVQGKWINPPGMEFLAVPIVSGSTDTTKSGVVILFSTTLTTVAQYREFLLAENKSRPWPKPDFPQGDDHPAVNVSWNDANDFCAWLTQREYQSGRLPSTAQYRLPSDHEWSCAVGIGAQENPSANPATLNNAVAGYPWGSAWPPPKNAGNYGEPLTHDGYENTSPVKVFPTNLFGLHDMGGNVWEWCEDVMSPGSPHALRGGSWSTGAEKFLRSSSRIAGPPSGGDELDGFRCVLVLHP